MRTHRGPVAGRTADPRSAIARRGRSRPVSRSLLVRHGKGGRRREVARTRGPGNNSSHGSRPGSSSRSDPCSASSTDPAAGDTGRTPPRAPTSAALPPVPVCGGASRRTNSGTPTPSRWPAKACPWSSSSASSTTAPRHHLDLPPRHRQRRDHRHRPRPPRPDDPGQHPPAPLNYAPRPPPVLARSGTLALARRAVGSRRKEHSSPRVFPSFRNSLRLH